MSHNFHSECRKEFVLLGEAYKKAEQGIIAALVDLGAVIRERPIASYGHGIFVNDRWINCEIQELNSRNRYHYGAKANAPPNPLYVTVGEYGGKHTFKQKKVGGLDYKAIAQCLIETALGQQKEQQRQQQNQTAQADNQRLLDETMKTAGVNRLSFGSLEAAATGIYLKTTRKVTTGELLQFLEFAKRLGWTE